MFVLSFILSLIYLGQHASSQQIGTSNPTIINPVPQQNPPPAFNPPPQQNPVPQQNPSPAFNPPPQQNPPPSDSQASGEGDGEGEYPILQISSPLVLALVIAAIAGIGGSLYVISRRYVMAE
jgi:hypothetical protein